MQLHAASIGEAVPRENFDAAVQSVFDSAVNMRLADEARLITLLVSDHYELPQGIRITTKTHSLHSLTVGQPAASRGGILRFDASPLTVDLRSAPVWICRVPELNADIGLPSVIEAWSSAWKLLNKHQRLKQTDIVADDIFRSETGSLLSRKISQPVMQLISATEQFDLQGSTRAVEKMIGLGPGVTPSGDDLVIGFLAGLWSQVGGNQKQLSFIHSLGNALAQITKQTNEISRTYLYHAARGQFSSSLSNLAEAIANGSQVEGAAREAMRVGHSSGMDSVTGLLVGMAVWSAEIMPHASTR